MYIQRGYDYLDEGDYHAAIAAFDSAIKLGLGDLAAAHVGMGMAYTRMGDYESAERCIHRALQEQPYMAAAYLARGQLRRAQHRNAEAIDDLTRALHIEPEYARAWLERAGCHEEARHFSQAEADYTRALELDAGLLAGYEARGRLRARRLDFDGAVVDMSHYLRSGGGKLHDNHSETQGYLLILRALRVVWGVVRVWRRG